MVNHSSQHSCKFEGDKYEIHVIHTSSLFSYQYTDGHLMVTDLQGYFDKTQNAYFLTDPAIQCRSLDLFDCTNLGNENMKNCLEIYKKYLTR